MSHNHKEDEELQVIRKQIESGKMKKIQAETRYSSLQDQYRKTATGLSEIGIDPKNAEETIRQLESEIANELAEIQALLPTV